MYFTANPQAHRDWQLQRLGQRDFDLLMVRANTTGKRDDKMALLTSKALIDSVLK